MVADGACSSTHDCPKPFLPKPIFLNPLTHDSFCTLLSFHVRYTCIHDTHTHTYTYTLSTYAIRACLSTYAIRAYTIRTHTPTPTPFPLTPYVHVFPPTLYVHTRYAHTHLHLHPFHVRHTRMHKTHIRYTGLYTLNATHVIRTYAVSHRHIRRHIRRSIPPCLPSAPRRPSRCHELARKMKRRSLEPLLSREM